MIPPSLNLTHAGDAEIRRWTPAPDEVLVLTCERNVTAAQAEHLRAALRQGIRDPNARVLVLAGGVRLDALTDSPDFWCSYSSVKAAVDHAAAAGPAGRAEALRLLHMWGDGP